MTFEKIKIAIESGKFEPIYFLCGEEAYFIDALTDLLAANVLTEAQRDFNQHLFYARDTDPQEVMNAARRYPVFADRQLIIVKEAQLFKSFDAFIPYVNHPVGSTVLVFNHKHKSLDKRTAFAKALKDKKAVIFEAEKVKEQNIPSWISNHLKSSGYKIDEKSAFLLTEHLGNDLAKIDNELKKLVLSIKDGNIIRDKHIEEFIGISKDFNAFEFTQAVTSKNYPKAMNILFYFEKNPKAGPIEFVLILLYGFFSKLYQLHLSGGMSDADVAKAIGINPYFLKDYKSGVRLYSLPKTEQIISEIAETDAKSKGINNSGVGRYELLKELIFRIMH
jgi:DNA polymerase-3 subunit delta